MYAISRQPVASARTAASGNRLYAAVLPAAAAVFAAVAAGIHAAVTDEYLTAWWGYGLFFFVVTLTQAGFALLVLSERQPAVFAFGLVGNVAMLGLYFVTHAVAVPFGPQGGEAVAVGRLDTFAALAEGGSVLVLLLLLGRAVANEPTPSRQNDDAIEASDR